ncbi:MAG: Bax inhibitor-1/YccA family protein [bacterium]|jgi:FtsH-binding integral membrane protein|nr:Bax inhibitor-1/YccA family protein [bacterium]
MTDRFHGRQDADAVPATAEELRQAGIAHDREAALRGAFIMRVYGYLMAAIAAFILIEVWLFRSGKAETLARALVGTNWMLVLGGFMVVGWLARGLAARATSTAAQFAGLAVYVVAQAIIFTPMIDMADKRAGGGVIASAAVLTGLAFTGLTLIAWQTRRDFTFLGGLLRWAGILALVAIAGSVFFGLNLGMWFSLAMVALAGGAILYDTSNIIRYWPSNRPVGAALELFASVALMFWYLLRLLSSRR